MKILVGYVPTPEGEAALEAAAAEAALRGASVLLLNTSRGDAYIDSRYANEEELDAAEARLRERGVEVTIQQAVGTGDVATELLRAAEENEVELDRPRPPPPQPRRQTNPRQHRPTSPPRIPGPGPRRQGPLLPLRLTPYVRRTGGTSPPLLRT